MTPLPPEFAEHFTLVARHYGCNAFERQEMREAVFRDPDAAVICFAALAAEIKQEAVAA